MPPQSLYGDSATMRNLLTSILTTAKIKVVGAASNGREALLMVSEFNPQLVFLDCDMPVMYRRTAPIASPVAADQGGHDHRVIRTARPSSKPLNHKRLCVEAFFTPKGDGRDRQVLLAQ